MMTGDPLNRLWWMKTSSHRNLKIKLRFRLTGRLAWWSRCWTRNLVIKTSSPSLTNTLFCTVFGPTLQLCLYIVNRCSVCQFEQVNDPKSPTFTFSHETMIQGQEVQLIATMLAWDPQGTGQRISLAGHPSRYQPCTTGLYTGEGVTQTFQIQKRTSTIENESYLKKTNQQWKSYSHF